MKNKKIAFIGIGNMGGAIVKGLVKSNFIPVSDICVSDKSEASLKEMEKLGVTIFRNNEEVARNADIVVVAVKPYHIEGVLNGIKSVLTKDKALISIVAGVELKVLAEMVSKEVPIFRVMPNTAIAIQESLTCISVNEHAAAYKDYIFELFDTLGKTVEIEENLMAAATAISSCGIAYALRYIRASMQGGVEIGFGAETAQFITAQTVKGAAELILQGGNHPEIEIDKVTTPMGVTITGLNEMERNGFSSALIQGLLASYKKIKPN